MMEGVSLEHLDRVQLEMYCKLLVSCLVRMAEIWGRQ
jgi:hypothetical protein